mmetsp:Transcript_48436/g.85382  ORF Transcript_48436/g.85382 Transcript_48436/m.85382 type:complete len:127 (-) Transcript_48436:403-783(-)
MQFLTRQTKRDVPGTIKQGHSGRPGSGELFCEASKFSKLASVDCSFSKLGSVVNTSGEPLTPNIGEPWEGTNASFDEGAFGDARGENNGFGSTSCVPPIGTNWSSTVRSITNIKQRTVNKSTPIVL